MGDPAVGRRERMTAPLLAIGGLTAATVALHVRDPHQAFSWGMCPTAALGFACPGCGGLRAVNDLTNGDVGAALSSNLLVVVLIPFAIVALAVWAVARWRGRSLAGTWERLKPLVPVLVVVAIVFTVARNLTFGAWLAP